MNSPRVKLRSLRELRENDSVLQKYCKWCFEWQLCLSRERGNIKNTNRDFIFGQLNLFFVSLKGEEKRVL